MGPTRTVRNLEALIASIDDVHQRIARSQLHLFHLIVELDEADAWAADGARDLAHWLSMRYGISAWKANRWIASAHAIQRLPRMAQALGNGTLSIDKVVELTRFATPETESGLIAWAGQVSTGAIRHRGDLASHTDLERAAQIDEERRLSWWYFDEGRRFGLDAELPAHEGAKVQRALERLAEQLPIMPGEEDAFFVPARRADALVALCSGAVRPAAGSEPPTVVIHASIEALQHDASGARLEGGGTIHAETVRRALCDARLQTLVEDATGQVIGLGRLTRQPSAWMVRQICHRDAECRFPGCGATRFTQAHHIVWWSRGGRTDLDNLVLLCSFHHKLVHEYGWQVHREPRGGFRWSRPDGTRYRAGPAPPSELSAEPAA